MSKLTKTTFKPKKTPKPKTCVVCKSKFTPTKIGQITCGYECAFAYINSPENKIKEKVSRALAKAERAETRKEKEALKTRSTHLKEAQKIFNSYIRERDKNEPCISCGNFRNSYDAGHFQTTGAHPELRFNEENCHKQCVHCNQWLSGNLINYRIGLVNKIGIVAVEQLEGYREPKKYTIEEIKQIKAEYSLKLKNLKARGE